VPQSIIDKTGSSKAELGKALVDAAPKRWVVYHPMVLLPAGSFASETWVEVLALLDQGHEEDLWARVVAEIGRREGVGADGSRVSRLSVNEGIPPTQGRDTRCHRGDRRTGREGGDGSGDAFVTRDDASGEAEAGSGEDEEENVIRAPTNLRMLHGDFGPEPTAESRLNPRGDDFDRAFWVATKQNGIVQTWAPRYTMFSRGNVKEKARLLDFHRAGADRKRLRGHAFAVDLYAGIGYFTFSYAKLGMRVLCWEINPWSVEALRRGAVMNGWSVRIAPREYLKGGETRASELVFGNDPETVIVFPETNENALARMSELVNSRMGSPDIVHVNCGLLPWSTPSWEPGLKMISRPEGWLHLHENVGVADIEPRRKQVQTLFDRWLAGDGEGGKAAVEHVEQVKTYAPGVWHCVFDVHVSWPADATGNLRSVTEGGKDMTMEHIGT
jgi:tRNA wybutosine-synthesizing protein 2